MNLSFSNKPKRNYRIWLYFLLIITISLASWFLFNPQIKQKYQDNSSGVAAIGGAFSLTDQNGNIFNSADFSDKLMLIFFGFTNCPSICPIAIQTMSDVMDELGESGNDVIPIFISIDPERDTPETIADYLSYFNPALVGLTGERPNIDQILDSYKIYHSKIDDSENYNMDHSGFIYLMNRAGKYISHFNHNSNPKEIISALKLVM